MFEAIVLAMQFLRFEEMPEDWERPKRAIYLDQEKLVAHFNEVKKRREEKHGDKSREIEDPVQNDAAEEWKKAFG
jgi:hypothetical protein